MDKLNLFFERLGLIVMTDGAFDLATISIFLLGVFIWIGLAAFAGSYVELRGGKYKPVFIIGLMFPVVVPLLSIILQPGRVRTEDFVPGVVIKEQDLTEKSQPKEEQEAPKKDDDNFDRTYFQLKLKQFGADHAYELVLEDREIAVNKIIECLPSVLLTEMLNDEGAPQRMRIPYVKIKGLRY